MQPLRQQGLLLVAAAQRPEERSRPRRTHVEIGDEAIHHRTLTLGPPPVAVEGRKHDVLTERERTPAAVVRAVPWQEDDSGRHRGGRSAIPRKLPVSHGNAAGATRPGSAENERQLADPGFLETREAENFADTQSERDVHELFARQALDLHERLAEFASRVGSDAEVRPETAEHR